MNIPHFNVNNLPLEVDSFYYPQAVMKEQERVCGAIDKRLDTLEREFCKLVSEANALGARIESVGFWEGFSLRAQLRTLNRRINLNRDLRHTLYDARWRRTYG